MSETLKFLQAASNAVAGNVAGPVDLISAALNKLGLNIQKPVGGSEWMRQTGLMADVPQGAAQVAGETFGLLAPTMAVAKAPQIAKGLLQMGDNLAAPRTLHPETGAIVWHGSPHKFDKFDSSKIGTGEGAQAYGHGLYFAESPEVSKTYMRTQINNAPELEQMALRSGVSPDAANTLAQWFHNTKDINKLDDFLSLMKTPHPAESISKFRQSVLKQEPALRKAWEQFSDPGSLYKVDLPDDAIAKMLDWDKPLSQQAAGVKDAIHRVGRSPDSYGLDRVADDMRMVEMQRLFQSREGVEALRNMGIPGIRYLDGGSRGAGSGTSNFVVFPGNEGLLTILERNGQALR